MIRVDRAPLRRRCLQGAVPLLAGLALGGTASSASAAVADTEAPRGAVGGVVSPASGTLPLTVRATDAGVGLARVEATIDGTVVASTALGGAGCQVLPPAAPAIAPPLGGCPAEVADLTLPVPTTAFADGPHRLQVTVTDAAGNGATLVDQALQIDNTPRSQQTSAQLTLSSGGTPDAPGGSTSPPDGSALGPAGSGGTGGAGTPPPGRRPACAAPRLSVFLRTKPLRTTKGGAPVVRRNVHYRYTGTLTCAVGTRRVRAPAGLRVALFSIVGKRTVRKHGVTTRSKGSLSAALAYPSSRVVLFRYTSGDGTRARVRIRIAVARPAKHRAKTQPAKKRPATKRSAAEAVR
ncbi:hypothetical protein AB0L40_01775 [Patulibacter sp. NPDC049589]|uniref:hypothetical protein n=1 Tax=Patulibacter sp. NPDC049589 TaxID=3154731 RepID=UPI003446B514